ncbi:MAG: efflux RND transporter permease subunit [Planctomycetota bacterium]
MSISDNNAGGDRYARGSVSWMARNPVAANLLMVLLLVGGFAFALNIKQEVFPEFTTDRVSIAVPYPGASPEEIEKGILLSIENAVRGLDGVKEVVALANEGSASVTVELLTSADPSKSLQDIKNAVDRITSFPELAERPVINLVETRTQVLSLVIYGDHEEGVLRALAERTREDLLRRPDITLAELGAARSLEIAVEIPQAKLRAYNLTLDQVARIVRSTALELPAGAVRTDGGEILLRTQERRDYAIEYRDIPVTTTPEGSIVFLGDLAEIRDTFEDVDQESLYNGKPSLRVEVFRVGRETPQSVSDSVRQYVAEIEPDLPPGVAMAIWSDQSDVYRDRIQLLLKNAGLGLILVLISLGLFLEPKLAFWVTLGIPISFLGAFVIIPLTGASLNMISLFAFIVTLGIVVDDAIVVGESIYEKRERGMSFLRAAVEGARDISGPVVFAVLTNIVAFLPLFFVPGSSGKFFRQIPAVVVTVFTISLIESLFILPAHLGHRTKDTLFWRIVGWPNKTFDRGLRFVIERVYAPSLKVILHWRYAMIALCICCLLLAVGLVGSGRLQFSFLPRIDTDLVNVSARLPFGVPVESTRQVQDRLLASLDEALERHGGREILRGVYTQIGAGLPQRGGRPDNGSSSGGSHILNMQAFLVSAGGRSVGGIEFANSWREATGTIPGLESVSFQAQIGVGGGSPIDVELSHTSVETLERAATELAAVLADYGGVSDIDDGFSSGKPQLSFRLTTEARSLGMTVSDLASQVRSSFFGAEALRQQRGQNEVKVMVRLPKDERESLATVENLILRTPAGGEIPLLEAATTERSSSYTQIRRKDGRRSINVTADVDPEVTNGNAVLNELAAGPLPALTDQFNGLSYSLTGERQTQQESLSALGVGFVLAIFAIFALLAISFSSYVQPLIIMFIIPFGTVGAIVGHYVLDYSLSMISFFGLVALSGIVINDSLVLVVTTNRLRAAGMDVKEAVHAAGVRRFRPILLTTLTTTLGLTPMLLETSVQARFLIPMAISIAGGELFSTIVLLGLVPAVYLAVEDVTGGIRRFLHWADNGASQEDTANEAPPESGPPPAPAEAPVTNSVTPGEERP